MAFCNLFLTCADLSLLLGRALHVTLGERSHLVSLIYFCFTDTNPLQLRINTNVYLPHNIKARTVIGNVTVTGDHATLVQPFLYYIDSVTQRQQSGGRQRGRGPNNLKRRRRDGHDICEGAGTIKPKNYFCIYRQSGYIEVTKDFVFVDGEEFDLTIRVTDSDPWGITESTASVQLILRDQCKEIRRYYDEAVKFCSNVSSAVIGEALSCPSIDCLRPLYSWRQALNKSSEEMRTKCSSDPQNMDALKQKYASCIGKSRVTLQVMVGRTGVGGYLSYLVGSHSASFDG